MPYHTHGQQVRPLSPDDDPANIIDMPYTAFELGRYDETSLSNIRRLLNWVMARGYPFEIAFRDPHDDTIEPSLWPLSLVFSDASKALHTRIRWSGDGGMWVYDYN